MLNEESNHAIRDAQDAIALGKSSPEVRLVVRELKSIRGEIQRLTDVISSAVAAGGSRKRKKN